MKLLKIKAIAWSALLLGLAQTSANGFSLDAFTSFETGETFQDAFVNVRRNPDLNPTEQTGLDSTVFGGKRELNVRNENSGNNTIEIVTENGEATFSVSGSTSGGVDINWYGLNGTGSGQNIELDGIDIQRSFQISIESLVIGTGQGNSGDGTLDLNFEIGDTSNNFARITKTLTSNIGSPTSIHFPYQDRVENGSNMANVSMANIDSIKFFTSSENVGDDFVFNLIQSSEEVPFEFSPTLGLILGGGLFGFLKFKKKAKFVGRSH